MKKKILTFAFISVMAFSACKHDKEKPLPNLTNFTLAENSKIKWIGKAGDGRVNEGNIKVYGRIDAEIFKTNVLGNLKRGEFDVPISSIDVTNLPPDLKPVLEQHLKTADFFYAIMHPNVKIAVISAKHVNRQISDDKFMVEAEMTLLGHTHPVQFPAVITLDGDNLKIKADFEFDRTVWGMNYHVDNSYPDADRILKNVGVNLELKATRN
ncbi:YceI family protein [Pedobacter arcticus]|uniref:YceI family protein n=1 Tax=Pedobacter arcticus TaxID=752140 RepID=UPI00031F2C56|nr:YceI family protein [Pedobacter arcticus]